MFTPEDRAHGKYAAKNENVEAVRKYVVGEGTIQLFKKYLRSCPKAQAQALAMEEVSALPTALRS